MRTKSVISTVLLVFVAFTVGAIVAKSMRSSSPGDASAGSAQTRSTGRKTSQLADRQGVVSTSSPAASAEGTPAKPHLVAYYFHATRRCPTCRKIESQAFDAITAAFGQLLADGRLRWESRNFEEEENHPLATKFGVVAPSLVIAKLEGNEVVAWKNLDQVWDLVHEPGPYARYVVDQFRQFIRKNMSELLAAPSAAPSNSGAS